MYSRCLLIIISLIKYSQATDECTGSGKVCGTAGQVCVDPTPEGSATQGDWWCQCVGQLKGAAIGRIANCGGGSVRVPASIGEIDSVVPVRVASSRLTALGISGWRIELESKIAALQGRITVLSNPISSSSETTVWIAFLPPNAVANRALFLSEALCCPLACSNDNVGSGSIAYSFCVSMGITSSVPLYMLPCESLDRTYCERGIDCSLSSDGSKCFSGTSSTPVHSAILIPILVTLIVTVLVSVFIRFAPSCSSTEASVDHENQSFSPQPNVPPQSHLAYSPPYGVPSPYNVDQLTHQKNSITR